MSIHVRADDVHLAGARGADLGAIHLLARAILRGLAIELAKLLVRLRHRIVVDAGASRHAAITRSAGPAAHFTAGNNGRRRCPLSTTTTTTAGCWRLRWRRIVDILDAV